jgi:hypothetical protein
VGSSPRRPPGHEDTATDYAGSVYFAPQLVDAWNPPLWLKSAIIRLGVPALGGGVVGVLLVVALVLRPKRVR